MRFVTCGHCHNEKIPLNSSLQVDDFIYCENCLKEKFPTDDALKGKTIVKEFDPTVCFSCAKDSGDMLLKRLGEYPVCDACNEKIKSRTFPTWVKAFFGGVIILVVFSFAWNWRFIHGYYQLENAIAAMRSQDFEQTAAAFQAVSTNVPEIKDYSSLANYYKGITLLSTDKSAEAYEAFQKCRDLPDNYDVEVYLTQAEISIAYSRNDYMGFVLGAKKFLSYDTTATAFAQVASAYSCLYAAEKADSSKAIANQYLLKARSAKDTTRSFAVYVSMIEYRLATGDNVNRQQFAEKFPNGWTNN